MSHYTTTPLEVVEPAHVDLTLSQLEVLVDNHFEAFQTFGDVVIPSWMLRSNSGSIDRCSGEARGVRR